MRTWAMFLILAFFTACATPVAETTLPATFTPEWTSTPPSSEITQPVAVPTPGLWVQGSVRLQDGKGLPGVKICQSFASYPGRDIAETNADGGFVADFTYIPGDEMVSIWPVLEGYTFEPGVMYWRHYYGYETYTATFSALPIQAASETADECGDPPQMK